MHSSACLTASLKRIFVPPFPTHLASRWKVVEATVVVGGNIAKEARRQELLLTRLFKQSAPLDSTAWSVPKRFPCPGIEEGSTLHHHQSLVSFLKRVYFNAIWRVQVLVPNSRALCPALKTQHQSTRGQCHGKGRGFFFFHFAHYDELTISGYKKKRWSQSKYQVHSLLAILTSRRTLPQKAKKFNPIIPLAESRLLFVDLKYLTLLQLL